MKIVICWSHISGYMAACWRALAAVPGVEVFVLGFESDAVAPFDPSLLAGVPLRLLSDAERAEYALTRSLVVDQRPDVLLVSGWFNPQYRKLVADPALKGVPKLLAMDTPFRGDWRQAVGRRLLRPLLGRFDRIVVAGERAFTYARYLGFTDARIRRGVYAVDYDAFAPCSQRRRAGEWPRTLLFTGRYAPEKGLDVLTAAYAKYRVAAEAGGERPWDLVCCGRGPLAASLAGLPGVRDLGFVPPERQAGVYAECGAFVLASRFDPWPLVVVEAAAAGLPLVCSTACGSAVEVLRDGFNGYSFASGDADALAGRLVRLTARADLALWGERSRQFAAAYAADLWPGRVFDGYL